jgi:transketolase
MDTTLIQQLSRKMRRKILEISFNCNNSAHLGGGLSIVDIMAVLYGGILRVDPGNPEWEERDRFILSKGHGVLGFYSALMIAGFFDEAKLNTFQTNDSDLVAHPVMNLPLGIESSNGSLGHGLSMGVGLALAAKKKSRSNKVVVLLGDGECDEGSVWEAAMAAAHFKLDNMIAIVDHNHFQSDGESRHIMESGDLAEKWKSFGWNVIPVNGHDTGELAEVLTKPITSHRPRVLIARTIKGKGISFMENNNDWHHNRLTKSMYETAIRELE